MKVCQECGREFKDDVLFCPIDGHALTAKAEAPALDDALVGTILDDKYRLDKKIGEGGMGAVYRATHVHMDSMVAVKLLHKSMVADQQAVERFRREARAAARIRHANAVSVTDFGVTKEGTVYLVMEYLEGHDLREKLRQTKTLSAEETVKIMMQTCAAIEEAHRKGIVHRDLKPDNIWLLKREHGDDEVVKVLDFGIAKLKTSGGASNLTQQGMIVGTPHYMSPEQCRGEELDARSDIYSLGIICYEMLTSDVPFRAATPVAVVLKHVNEQPRPLREINPSVPEQIEAVVMKAIQKDKEARQTTALDFGRELLEALRASGASTSMLRHLEGATIAGFPAPFPTGAHHHTTGSTQAAGAAATSAITGPAAAVSTGGQAAVGATQVMTSNASGPIFGQGATSRTISTPAPSETNTKMIAVLAIAVVVLLSAAVGGYFVLKPSPPETPLVSNTNEKPPTVDPSLADMVLVTGGTFMMGTDDPNADEDAKPAHSVTVADFYMDLHEVTNEEYARFCKQERYPPPPHWKDGIYPSGEGNMPVTMVSWQDATKYAEWAGKRLPKEAEWEYAARGRENRNYPWGNDWSDRLSNSKELGRDGPQAVGSYSGGVSPFGIFDMAGNVAEWVADDFAPYPGSKEKPDPGNKVYKGGSYKYSKEDQMVWMRYWDYPTAKFPELGFRCAKDAK